MNLEQGVNDNDVERREETVVNNGEVERRQETVVTRHPGFDETVQVTRDIAADRRMHLYRTFRLLWSIFWALEILMMIRFILRFIGANPQSGFTTFIYGFTNLFVGPFNGMLPTPAFMGAPIEVTTLIAMAVYVLVFLVIAYIIQLATDRPTAQSFTRITHEETPEVDGIVPKTRKPYNR